VSSADEENQNGTCHEQLKRDSTEVRKEEKQASGTIDFPRKN
jgi:hypothetical protein